MKRALALAATVLLSGAVVVLAGKLANSSFETDFGPRETQNMWGEFGEVFGEAYQVFVGKDGHTEKARSGDRVLLINVGPGSWNGAWQQVPWAETSPFAIEAYYLIQGGDLPEKCATFIKAEFLDGSDRTIDSVEGLKHKEDTKGQWKRDVLEGETPAGTASIRFVVIAGDNAGGPVLVNRIYWDDVNTMD